MPTRPATPASGPPGLAALMDAERSVLREHHERLRVLTEAEHVAALRAVALEDAIRLQQDARRQTRGMRDRLRARELDRRLLTADARSIASAAASAAEAARLRVLATERRLDEIRGLVDSQSGEARADIDALRRPATLPESARLYPTIAAFITDRPSRAIGDPREQDLLGQPYGDRWLLEEAAKPWVVCQWRAFWAATAPAAIGEVYAVERSIRPHAARRVWLLGEFHRSEESVGRVESLLSRQPERNSLAVLADVLSLR
jgi:hypothetical protein